MTFCRSFFADKTSRRYSRCMGIEYEGTGYHNVPDDHPFIILQKLMFLGPTCLTPYFYLRIFFFRYFKKETFLDKNSIKRRKIGNIVSFSYNILIWISDLSALIMVCFGRILNEKYFKKIFLGSLSPASSYN